MGIGNLIDWLDCVGDCSSGTTLGNALWKFRTNVVRLGKTSSHMTLIGYFAVSGGRKA